MEGCNCKGCGPMYWGRCTGADVLGPMYWGRLLGASRWKASSFTCETVTNIRARHCSDTVHSRRKCSRGCGLSARASTCLTGATDPALVRRSLKGIDHVGWHSTTCERRCQSFSRNSCLRCAWLEAHVLQAAQAGLPSANGNHPATPIKTKPRIESNRVLVTGGAGFVGSHLCTYLVERGDHVCAMQQKCQRDSAIMCAHSGTVTLLAINGFVLRRSSALITSSLAARKMSSTLLANLTLKPFDMMW